MTMVPQEWRPAADVYETPTTVDITLEIAGVSPDDIRVNLSGSTIVVEGRRALPGAVHPHGRYSVVEIRRGQFRAQIPLSTRVAPQPRELRSEMGFLVVSLTRLDPGNGHG
jgi:HSP20 family protein